MLDDVLRLGNSGNIETLPDVLGPNGVWVGINTVEYDSDEVVDFLAPFVGRMGTMGVSGDPVRTVEGIAFPVMTVEIGEETEVFFILLIGDDGSVRLKEQGFLPALGDP